MKFDQLKPDEQSDQRKKISMAGPEKADETDRLFSPDSMISKISGEALLLLGGGRAILMQIAHPLVAAGVAEYSKFQTDPLARLFRTMTTMHTIVFEKRQHAVKALNRFHDLHDHIRGKIKHDAGPFPAGTPYWGSDPILKQWVHAALIDTTLKTYERFVRPLSFEERSRFYSDELFMSQLLKIPEEILPQTLEEFQEYINTMINSDTLTVTETSRELAKDVLHPKVAIIPSLSARLLRFVTAGTMPGRLRTDYGMKWNQRRQYILDGLSRSTRFVRPFARPWIWQSPLIGGKLARSLLWGALRQKELKQLF